METIPVALVLAAIFAMGSRTPASRGAEVHPIAATVTPQSRGNLPSLPASNRSLSALAAPGDTVLTEVVVISSKRSGTEPYEAASIEVPEFSPFREKAEGLVIRGRDVARFAATTRGFTTLRRPTTERIAERPREDSADVGTSEKTIRLNSATTEELTRIPGIGPTRASSIVEKRPAGGFSDWNDLRKVPGIGARTLEVIQLHATLN